MRKSAIIYLFVLLTACAPSQGSPHFPLDEGVSWEYTVQGVTTTTQYNMTTSFSSVYKVTNMTARTINEERVFPQKMELISGDIRDFQGTTFFFYRVDDVGAYIYATQGPSEVVPEVYQEEPVYIFRSPSDQSWEEMAQSSLSPNQLVVAMEVIVERDVSVTASVGTFEDCLLYSKKGEGEETTREGAPPWIISIEEHTWFCRGIGIVRSLSAEKRETEPRQGWRTSTQTLQVTTELTAFSRQ